MIPPSTALQIAGRAGRFGTTWEDGEVTTFKGADLQQLKKLLSTSIEPIKVYMSDEAIRITRIFLASDWKFTESFYVARYFDRLVEKRKH